MNPSDARALVDALFEEIDNDALLGSMLYAMSSSEKTQLEKRLVNRILEHEYSPA